MNNLIIPEIPLDDNISNIEKVIIENCDKKKKFDFEKIYEYSDFVFISLFYILNKMI